MPRKKKTGKRKTNKSAKYGVTRAASKRPVFSVEAALAAARDQLVVQRSAIERKISAIEMVMSDAKAPIAAPTGRGRGRHGPRAGSLKEYIGRVLSARGDVMGVGEIATSVVRTGYKTKNKTLAKSVGIALTQMSNVERVARGKFRIR